MHEIFKISKKVQEAINRKKPIVALESTLISHGLPYPENIKVANESIKAVEDNGAIAATIGIIRGKVKIGLSQEDIQILAKEKNVQKVSNHNINLSIFNKESAPTVRKFILRSHPTIRTFNMKHLRYPGLRTKSFFIN